MEYKFGHYYKALSVMNKKKTTPHFDEMSLIFVFLKMNRC
jgi:hypothetical protein